LPTVSIDEVARVLQEAVDAAMSPLSPPSEPIALYHTGLPASPSELLAVNAFHAVPEAIAGSVTRQHELGAAEGVLVNVVVLLKAHLADEAVIEVGLKALLELCQCGSASHIVQDPENIRNLGEAGACEVVALLLHQHLSHPKIAEQVSEYDPHWR
jgi:hypothetical protein